MGKLSLHSLMPHHCGRNTQWYKEPVSEESEPLICEERSKLIENFQPNIKELKKVYAGESTSKAEEPQTRVARRDLLNRQTSNRASLAGKKLCKSCLLFIEL